MGNTHSPTRQVFLDEAGAKTNLTRRCGQAQRGARVHASAPAGQGQTTTMLASIRLDGSTGCMTIEGATDTEVLQTHVRAVLCPTLRPGDLVVMDSLSPHKHDPTLRLIERIRAAVRFLPAYSSAVNPIEKMWSKVKQSPWSAEACTCGELQTAIAAALDAVNWFAHGGRSLFNMHAL